MQYVQCFVVIILQDVSSDIIITLMIFISVQIIFYIYIFVQISILCKCLYFVPVDGNLVSKTFVQNTNSYTLVFFKLFAGE